jgi:excinuclease UvrABC nuclease subunit
VKRIKAREIQKKWSPFKEEKIKDVPDVFGVYELADENREIVYIGHGKLKERLSEHFRKKTCPGARFFRYEKTSNKERAEEREKALLKRFEKENKRLPECNKRLG